MKQTVQWTINYPDGSKATVSHLGAKHKANYKFDDEYEWVEVEMDYVNIDPEKREVDVEPTKATGVFVKEVVIDKYGVKDVYEKKPLPLDGVIKKIKKYKNIKRRVSKRHGRCMSHKFKPYGISHRWVCQKCGLLAYYIDIINGKYDNNNCEDME